VTRDAVRRGVGVAVADVQQLKVVGPHNPFSRVGATTTSIRRAREGSSRAEAFTKDIRID
tara:strand:- start:948 stop:1127 length:180 start_codon:yes stop_codon:yes gene_type:complete